MKKILPLLLFLSVLSVTAQITVSGTCNNNPTPIGTYSDGSGAMVNGRNVYTIDGLPDCGENATASSCAGGGSAGTNTRYRIFWSGSQWVLEEVNCYWDAVLEGCTTQDYGNGNLLASNNADTSLPPNGDWVSNTSGCNFTVSGGSLSIDTISTNPLISIHPNPTFGEITVDFGLPITNAELKVLDIKGQTILTMPIQASNRETIKLNQAAGFYFLNVSLSDGKQYYYKIIKK
ncbi:MAG: hypothetical protein CMP76_04635 [Flavobacterium sp.]|uniref:T9SS type A sorting domain-containing protein n=1 Tax=Flavobacterium sp. TaxID=239 RepID=UPI000C6C1498|nr:T9SS type A sorting domain-containing protein [Flavobacterium sp.]MBF02565.1 hypothetical protein [Flavobacterium sp.]|tara:strand:+ start:2297 stop:2995 length:699 start_codon:yes stop_codon:yes gene_type:complete